jgi:SsrA-binding protein
MKVLAQNKKIFFDYSISETIEAGIVLTGDEVKAIRAGQASLIGAYAIIQRNELFLLNCTITPYKQAYSKGTDPARSRKLLVKRSQINKLIGTTKQKGVTLLPLKLYTSEKNLIKVAVGVGTHKKIADKRETIKKRESDREMRRALKQS